MAENVVRQRLAAILAADVAGYSRLMGDDERATIDAINQCRAIFREHIEANGGRVVDMAGDSVLAIFDTAIGAFTTAMAAQESLAALNTDIPDDRRMAWRIGVNLGDIHEQDDGTVYGDGVNVAARLEGLAEPGGICVSGKVRDELRGKIDRSFADLGEHEVKNIAEPVRAYRVLAEGEVMPRAPGRARRLAIAGAAAVVVALIVAMLWPGDHHQSPPEVATAEPEDPILALPSGPSIAVLPFDNMSGDPEQEYFADGIAEDLITKLSRFPDYLVIARNTTFQYKGQAVDVREVGRELGARFVVEGSVRRSADTIRITVQLIDVETEGHLWADSFDRELTAENIFAVQDEITEQLAGTIGDTFGIISLSGYEGSKVKGTASLSAYECVLGAHGYYASGAGPAEHARVRECLEQAVENSPNYADAWAWLAAMYRDEYMFDFNTRPNPLERAEQAARRSIELQHDNQEGHLVLAHVYFFQHDLDAFRVQADKMLAINPNSADALASMAYTFVQAGDWERAIAMVEKAIRLNPNYPPWFHWVFYWDDFNKGEYQAALARIKKGPIRGYFLNFALLAAVHGKLKNQLEAQKAIEELRSLHPTYSLGSFREYSEKWNYPEHLMEAMVDGLRKAGLPDTPPSPSRPVIAVLPFNDMSEDADHQFFADGIAEDIITRLARFPDIGVIARNSSFQYKGESVDVRTVAEELGATYVLEGSVRRSENDIRVIAQLLDATDGTHLWAETYDRDLSAGSVFEIQDDITERVVGAIASADSIITMAVVEASAGKAPADLASYECVMRAMDYWRVITPDAHLAARTCLERVISEEPDYAQAYVVLAAITTDELLFGYNPQPEMAPALDRALRYAERAIDLDTTSGWSHWALARVLYFRHDLGGFRSEAERAVELAPNEAMLLAGAGVNLCYSGSWERGFELMERAIELNPHHQTWYHIPYFYDAYRLGQDEEALAAARRINMPGFFWTHLMLAAAYGQLDMASEAAGTVKTLQEVYPGYTINPDYSRLGRIWLVSVY